MDDTISDNAVYEPIVPYPCPTCKAVFLSVDERSAHLASEHNQVLQQVEESSEEQVYLEEEEVADGSYYVDASDQHEHELLVYECQHCMKHFPSNNALFDHSRIHHPTDMTSKTAVCKFCSLKFSNKTYLKYHMEKCQSLASENKCTMCFKIFASKHEVDTHRKICPKNMFPCDFCKFRFPSRRTVYDHIRTTHRKTAGDRQTPKKKYTCLFCGKKFIRRQDMETHQRTHTGDKPFKCKICEKGFVSNSELHHHMPTHSNVKGFRCQFCGITYKNISTLTHHRRVKHLNPVKVPCPFPECQYVGPSEKLLKCHIRTQHIEYKTHTCECGKAFSSRSHLYDHRRRKHDPNPKQMYSCKAPGCTRVFSKQFVAERHFIREHEGGVEDFRCSKCSRSFKHEETLKQHYSMHKTSQFYYCPKCYTVISTERGIVNHMAQCMEMDEEEEQIEQQLQQQEAHEVLLPKVVEEEEEKEELEYEVAMGEHGVSIEQQSLQLTSPQTVLFEQGKQFVMTEEEEQNIVTEDGQSFVLEQGQHFVVDKTEEGENFVVTSDGQMSGVMQTIFVDDNGYVLKTEDEHR